MRNFYPVKVNLTLAFISAFSILIISCSKSPKPVVEPQMPVTITAFAPAKALSNAVVTITGTNFNTVAANNTVTFNGVAAKINSATATQIVVTVPATAATGKIDVLNNGKKATSATNFTVTTGVMSDYVSFGALDIDQIKFDGTGRMFGGDGKKIYEIQPNAQSVYYTPVGDFTGFAVGVQGDLYIPVESAVVRVSPQKNVTIVAGSYYPSAGGIADGTGADAKFGTNSLDLAIDAAGNLYFLGVGSIRKITSGGVVTTPAGINTGERGYVDGAGAAAKFGFLTRETTDPSGNLYVVDSDHFRIRKITPDGVVSTVIGNGTFGLTDGEGTKAQMFGPQSLVSDAEGNIFFSDADFENHLYRIRMLNKLGQVITLISGNTTSGIVNGSLGTATTNRPLGLAFDAAGDLYIVNSGVHKISKITFN